MTHIYKTLVSVGALAALTLAGAACAQDATPSTYIAKHAGQFVVVARVTTVAPAEKGDIVTAAGAATGLHVSVNNDTVPTLGFSYFFTDHVAVEAILGTSKHTISAVGGTTNVQVHDTWVLPPVVTLQYHFNPAGRVSPYIGAGVNYMAWYGGKDKNGFKVRLKDGLGTAVQGGVDIALQGHWALNVDYKKVFYNTNARINDGALKSHVKLNPSVVSLGVAYRF